MDAVLWVAQHPPAVSHPVSPWALVTDVDTETAMIHCVASRDFPMDRDKDKCHHNKSNKGRITLDSSHHWEVGSVGHLDMTAATRGAMHRVPVSVSHNIPITTSIVTWTILTMKFLFPL